VSDISISSDFETTNTVDNGLTDDCHWSATRRPFEEWTRACLELF